MYGFLIRCQHFQDLIGSVKFSATIFSFTSCKAPRIISSQKEQTLIFIFLEPRLSWFP